MELIVQLFRALANYHRLAILRLLCVLGDTTVSDLAKALGRGMPRVSADLRTLSASGLVWRRRSGRRISYRLAERPGNALTAAVLRAIRRAFAHLRADDPRSIASAGQGATPGSSDAALFACFTAFTHPRRLQILRFLERYGRGALPDLTRALSMSPRACLRHLAKLERRGLLARRAAGRGTTCALARPRGPVARAILAAVRERLAAMGE